MRKRVLILEDDQEMLEALQAWAQQLGCDVRAARTGSRGLELSQTFKPQVLITDYLLEDDLTGVDVIVTLGKLGVHAACVLITGVLHEALRESLDRIHGVVILAKPVNFDRLRQIVSAA